MIVLSHSIVRETSEPVLQYMRVDSPNVGCEGSLRIKRSKRRVAPCPLRHSFGRGEATSSCLAVSERNSSRCSNLRLRGF